MKRLSIALLSLSALLALGGCALEPAYQYNANAGGGYYSGQSAYGNANTVIYSSGYVSPWGGGWGPTWGYGSGWSGYGGFGFGATYVYRPHQRHWRHDRHHARRGSHHQQRHHDHHHGHHHTHTKR